MSMIIATQHSDLQLIATYLPHSGSKVFKPSFPLHKVNVFDHLKKFI